MTSATDGVRSTRQAVAVTNGANHSVHSLDGKTAIEAHLRAASAHMSAALMHQEAARHYERGLDREARAYGRSAQANSQVAHTHSVSTIAPDDLPPPNGRRVDARR
jgi:hypothetical protein